MRKVWVTLVFGLVPAAVVAGAVLLTGIAIMAPRFVARAAFVIDWKTMPSVPSDEAAEKVRNKWRESMISDVTSLPQSKQAISDLLNRSGDFDSSQSNKAVVIPKLNRWLSVTVAHEANDCDRFSIEMRDNDPKWAKTMVSQVLEDDVSRLKTEAAIGSGLAALRSKANVEKLIQRESDLKSELRKLENTYSRPFDDAVAQRCEAIEEELQKLEVEHFGAGLGFFVNLGGMFTEDPIKVIEAAHVEPPRAEHSLRVVLAAVGLGGMAGLAGLLMRRVVLATTTAKAKAIGQPPVMSRYEGGKPPPLPRAQPPASNQ